MMMSGTYMARCPVCSGECREVVFSETFEVEGYTVTVKGVPGEECTLCGKRAISKSTAEALKVLVDSAVAEAGSPARIKRIYIGFDDGSINLR
ncbi:MAG: YgiT-type zinc finger protein [Thermoplasmata archaeon]